MRLYERLYLPSPSGWVLGKGDDGGRALPMLAVPSALLAPWIHDRYAVKLRCDEHLSVVLEKRHIYMLS